MCQSQDGAVNLEIAPRPYPAFRRGLRMRLDIGLISCTTLLRAASDLQHGIQDIYTWNLCNIEIVFSILRVRKLRVNLEMVR